jgi:hypothetical protein
MEISWTQYSPAFQAQSIIFKKSGLTLVEKAKRFLQKFINIQYH